MHLRRPQTLLFLIASILLTGLLAGCGGGDESGNGSQDGGSGGAERQGGEAAKQDAQRPKIALGTVTRVKTERRRMVIRAITGEKDAKPMPFKIAKNATITLDNEEAALADIQEGQEAQITYVAKNELNLAREVTLISGGGANPGSGENTG